jgi:group I intron endonuclease
VVTIYKHTNKLNSKCYIGITKLKVEKRWKKGNGYKSQKIFYGAIKKYGWENFEHKIIDVVNSWEEALKKESYYIKLYNSIKNGYNSSQFGNFDYKKDKKVYEIISQKLKKQKLPQWHKDILLNNVKTYWSKKENLEKYSVKNKNNEFGNREIFVFDTLNSSLITKKSITSFAKELNVKFHICQGALTEGYSILKRYYIFRTDNKHIWLF